MLATKIIDVEEVQGLTEKWLDRVVEREWGWYTVLEDNPNYKVKELVIEPGKSLSNQRHFMRSEHWRVLKGSCTLNTEWQGVHESRELTTYSSGYTISTGVWHQAINNTNEPCHILEVQYGEACVEEDIERRD